MRFPNVTSLERLSYLVASHLERFTASGALIHLAVATLVAYVFLLLRCSKPG